MTLYFYVAISASAGLEGLSWKLDALRLSDKGGNSRHPRSGNVTMKRRPELVASPVTSQCQKDVISAELAAEHL